jgi:hypothetical protein
MPRANPNPARKDDDLNNTSAATIARSWLYQMTVRELDKTGMTKREIIRLAEIMMEKYPDLPPMSEATMNSYLKAAVRYGLLDAAGNSQRRRYYPPRHLRAARRENLKDGASSARSGLDYLKGQRE